MEKLKIILLIALIFEAGFSHSGHLKFAYSESKDYIHHFSAEMDKTILSLGERIDTESP